MPRKPRCHYSHAVYHVMLRGNAKQDIFFDDCDRQRLCLLIQEACERYSCEIYAFCFMNNHIHLLVRIAEMPLAKFMHNISFRYTNWINKRFARVGHLFQGRYKAIVVEDDAYLITLVRYIHLNPVRANLIENLNETWWSSHEAYLGQCDYPWLNTEFTLSMLSLTKSQAIEQYRNFIEGSVIQENDFESPLYKILTQEKIIRFVCEAYQITKADLYHKQYVEPCAVVAWLCKALEICSMRDIAIFFQQDKAGFTRRVKILICEKPKYLNQMLEKIKSGSGTVCFTETETNGA